MREHIRQLQAASLALGHNPGPIDGLWGAKTAAALQSLLAAGGKPPAATPAPLTPATTAIIYQGTARHPVREIVIHCSATRPEWYRGLSLQAKRDEIRRWHVQDRGWNDIGYHWLIDRDGAVLPGRAETVIGAHVEGRNSGTIGICLIGGHGSGKDDRFSDHFTVAQDVTLRQLIAGISSRTQITKVSGHNDYANRSCPGFTVSKWLGGA